VTAASMWRRRLPLLAAAALFAGGNLAFLLTYRSGWQTRREALEARRDGLRQAAASHEAEATRLAGQRERLTGVSSAIAEFYGHRVGSQRETLAAIVGDLHAVLTEAGVSTAQISYATTQVQKLPLTALSISFAVKCDYARFKKMLKAFEASRRWIVVRSLGITREPEQAGAVSVQFDLITYFAEPGAAPAEPVPAKPLKAAAAARRAG
jgi:Tfp pilus assembly protein PilO